MRLAEGTLIIKLLLDVIFLIIIMNLTNVILRKKYTQEVYGRRMIIPWLFVPIVLTMIGFFVNIIIILNKSQNSEIPSFISITKVISDSNPIFFYSSLIVLAIYGLVGICLGLEFTMKNSEINKGIEEKRIKLNEESIEK